MRRKLSVICRLLGTLMLIAAASLYGYNRWDDYRAGREVSSVQDRIAAIKADPETAPRFRAEEEEHPENPEMATIKIDGQAYIGTLSIERFGLELPVLAQWSYEGLRTAPGRYTGTTMTNDLVLCGHNYDRHFGHLKELKEGDEILFTDVKDQVYTYHVAQIETLQPTAVEEMIDREEGQWDLTLFTCTIGGQARVTVRCQAL